MSLSISPTIVFVAVLIVSNTSATAMAEPHELRERGRTFIEAEDYSALGKSGSNSPRNEDSEWCSGKKNLGFLWASLWFEFNVKVPRLLNYTISMRVASEKGSQIQVQMRDASGGLRTLDTIDVPMTGSWRVYTNTEDATLSLPAGEYSLRFKTLSNGANVDYVTFSAGDEDDVVVTSLAPNAGPETNPLKGFISHSHRENADYASVGSETIEWGKFEPEDDVFDWDYVESVLHRPGVRGRHFILQVHVDWDNWELKEPVGDSHYKGPAWLLDRVGEERGPAFPDDPNSRTTRATRYNDPVFVNEATEAITALLERYREDPRTFVLQAGLLGYWGEWHTSPREEWGPTQATKFAILDAYTNNLGTNALTQVRYPDEPVVEPRPGLGYANGSATLTDYGRKFGDAIAHGTLWKNGPIGGEWPADVELKHWGNFFLTDDGKAFIEQARYTTLLPPEASEIIKNVPGWAPDGRFMEMHRLMGYNFQAKAVRHLVAVDDSGQAHFEVDLHNAGIAPFYKDWDVQLAVLNSDTGDLIEKVNFDTDLRNLGPGETVTLSGSISGKANFRGRFQIALRILQPGADKEKTTEWGLDARNTYVVLANELKVVDGMWDDKHVLQGGWNVLGSIERRQPDRPQKFEGDFYPFQGSFRPAERP